MKETVYVKDCKAQFHPTLANDKLGGKSQKIMAVSYVPGKDPITLKNGTLVSDCIGTCRNVDCSQCGQRGVCYAIDSYTQYPAVTKNRVENTIQLREDINQHFEDIYNTAIKNKVEIIRYTESGDFEDYNHFEHFIALADRLPEVQLYVYTKNYAVLREYFGNNLELPDNVTVLISVWGEQGIAEYNEFKDHKNIKCFAVNSTIKCDATCPAYKQDENGKVYRVKSDSVKCGKCGLCTGKIPQVKVIKCIEH